MKYIDNPIANGEKLAKYIAKELRAEIGRKDITLKEIAEKTGMSLNSISLYLGNRPTNNEDTYRAIAHAI